MLNFAELGCKRNLKDFLKFKKYVLFGSGEASDEVFKYLSKQKKEIICYLDNNPALINKKKNNINIYSPSKINEIFKKDIAIVISSSAQKEIANQLENDFGIPRSNIFPYVTQMFSTDFNTDYLLKNKSNVEKALALMADKESYDYFMRIIKYRWTLDPFCLLPNPQLLSFYNYKKVKLSKGDVIIDCGAYIGDTAEMYLKSLDGNCRIFAIEAFPTNYEKLNNWIRLNKMQKKVFPMLLAVGNKSGHIELFHNDNFDPRASLKNNKKRESMRIEMQTIDNLFFQNNERINLIKMDIEGAEMDALKGAKKIISRDSPNLAIAGYHIASHLWEIPILINKLNPKYKIYAGHHPKCIYEIEFYVKPQ